MLRCTPGTARGPRTRCVLLNEAVVLLCQIPPLVLREVLGGVLRDVDVLVLQLPQVGLAHLARGVHELSREALELGFGILGS